MKATDKLWILTIALLVFAIYSYAAPEAPTLITDFNSSRKILETEKTLPAQAGNVTFLTMNVTTASSSWSAYYGNINGTLVLSNSNNNSVYLWQLDRPTGEVFMVNESIDFSNIECWNDTRTDDASYYTLSEFESWLGVDPKDEDGVNETFSSIGTGVHDAFYVGTKHFAANSCPSTSMYNSTGQKEADKFQEMLLYDPTQEVVVYTAIIEQNATGFNGNKVNFELIVGDDGHTNDQATEYYIYIELE